MCNTELQKGARMKNYQGSFVKLSIFATAFMLRSSAAITLSDGEVKRLKFGNDDNRINTTFFQTYQLVLDTLTTSNTNIGIRR